MSEESRVRRSQKLGVSKLLSRIVTLTHAADCISALAEFRASMSVLTIDTTLLNHLPGGLAKVKSNNVLLVCHVCVCRSTTKLCTK